MNAEVRYVAGKFDPPEYLEALALAVRASAVSLEDVERLEGTANDWLAAVRCLECGDLFHVELRWDEATDRLPDIEAPRHTRSRGGVPVECPST